MSLSLVGHSQKLNNDKAKNNTRSGNPVVILPIALEYPIQEI